MTLHERIAAQLNEGFTVMKQQTPCCGVTYPEKYGDKIMQELLECKAIITEQQEIINIICTPRRWTREMNDAWHQNIPDVDKAFKALLTTALKGE